MSWYEWPEVQQRRLRLKARLHGQAVKPQGGRYYDLLHLPHGHFPIPMLKRWRGFPILARHVRDEYFYSCSCCGEPSFFQEAPYCRECWELHGDPSGSTWLTRRENRDKRRTYFKNLWKRLDCLFLPILVLLNRIPARILPKRFRRYRAWYVVSLRHHEADPDFWEYYQKHIKPLDEYLASEDFQRQLERDYLEDYDPIDELLVTNTKREDIEIEEEQRLLEEWM